jgi:hypothetical protein
MFVFKKMVIYSPMYIFFKTSQRKERACMKKYVLGLLLIVQNVCAMEIFISNGMRATDEKCKLVAKYLYKYPKGRGLTKNYNENLAIQDFFKDPDRIVLSHRVQQYMSVLQKAEDNAEEILQLLYGDNNFPVELKEKVWFYALWGDAQQYYAISSALRFIGKDKCHVACYNGSVIHDHDSDPFFKPYFLRELNEVSHDSIEFSFYGTNKKEIVSDDSVKCIKLLVPCRSYKAPIYCDITIRELKEHMFFVEATQDRVSKFKQFFNEIVIYLSEMDNKTEIREFVYWLGYFKNLTNSTLSFYKK